MRLVSFLKEGRWYPGLRRGDNIVEVADSDLTTARAVIAAVAQGRRLTEGPSHSVAEITLGLPVPDPDKIICIGLNYVDHARGIRIQMTDLSRYWGDGTKRMFTGPAIVNGASDTATITVTDRGEPGRGFDTFRISLASGYTADGTLAGGNIQLHA